MNKVILYGRLGKDPDLRYTGSGIAVANFSIATTERWKDGEGNKQERTDWHNIVVWRKLGEVCAQYLKKGQRVLIIGKVVTRSYDDKNTGVKKYVTDVVADEVEFIETKGETGAGNGGEEPASSASPAKSDAPPPSSEDDPLPF